MYKHILVPIVFDHGERGDAAIDVARKLLDADGKISLVHVMEDIPAFVTSQLPEGVMESNRTEVTNNLSAMANKIGDIASADVVGGRASRAIIEYGEKHGTDCIVIASHKPGFEDYFLGSTASRVVRHAKCCVHILR
jgi:nucleotide-binding universal stress UspA family protein